MSSHPEKPSRQTYYSEAAKEEQEDEEEEEGEEISRETTRKGSKGSKTSHNNSKRKRVVEKGDRSISTFRRKLDDVEAEIAEKMDLRERLLASEEEAFYSTFRQVLRDALSESTEGEYPNIKSQRELTMLYHHGADMMQRIERLLETYRGFNEMLATKSRIDMLGEGWEEAEVQARRLVEVGRLAAREQVSRLADVRGGGSEVVEEDVQEGNAVLDLGREGKPRVEDCEGFADALEKIGKSARRGSRLVVD